VIFFWEELAEIGFVTVECEKNANEMYGLIKAFSKCNVWAHESLRFWKAHIQEWDLSHFQALKDTRMCPEKKTEFVISDFNLRSNLQITEQILALFKRFKIKRAFV